MCLGGGRQGYGGGSIEGWGGARETVEIVRGAILNYPPGSSTTERVASL